MCTEAIFIGAAAEAAAFLNVARLVDIARQANCDAVHPGHSYVRFFSKESLIFHAGYGFMSESADFAQACADAGLVFVGPSPTAIQSLSLIFSILRNISHMNFTI